MSHAATNWAIVAGRGHGLSGNAKLLLWHLADCHNPVHGTFPDQGSLAEWCEFSRATVNRCLDELEKVALIRRLPRIDPNSGKQRTTLYMLRFEWQEDPLYVGARVANRDTALTTPRPVEKPVNEVSKTPANRVSKIAGPCLTVETPITSKEPNTPLSPLEEGSQLAQLCAVWDADLVKPQAVERAYTSLSADERHTALEMVDTYRRAAYALKRPLPQMARYLRRRLWTEFINAPPIENGLFRITPDRSEWPQWLEHFKRVQGPVVWTGTKRQGFTLVPTRHPPSSIPEPKDDDDA